MRWMKAAISFICGTYAFAVLIYSASRLLPGDRVWWLALIDNFMFWYFLPLAALLPLALLARARRGLLLLLPVAALAAGICAPYFMPRARAAAAGPSLRVVTFNIWGGSSRLPAEHFEGVADWLRMIDADVIFLQELPHDQRERGDGFLGLGALYASQFAPETRTWTNGTLTRLPVIEQTSAEMTETTPHCQRLVLDLDGQPIAVYNIHTSVPTGQHLHAPVPPETLFDSIVFRYDETVRNRQIEHLMTVLARETLPYIVAGDFNTSDQSLIYPRIASLMGDSFREAGFGFGTSWPVSAAQRETFGFLPPLVRIDYIWHSRDWVATQAAQGPPLGSDHLALTATLALNGSR